MHVVWLTAVLLYLPVLTLCDPLNILMAPNLLRVGTPEKVFVEAQDYGGNDLPVKISVMNFPHKTVALTSVSVVLTATNNYQAVADIMIPYSMWFVSSNPLEKQYVYLQAVFPSKELEKVVMISLQPGYIFIQTDKSIYRPGTKVVYRLFLLTPNLQATDQSEEIYVKLKDPRKNSVYTERIFSRKGIGHGLYNIPEFAKSGIWSITTWYKKNKQKKFTAEFEVKEYVLPSIEVTLKPSRPFFYVDDNELHVDITAKYLFGKNVDGIAFVVFEIMQDDTKTTLPASLKREQIINGMGRAVLTRDMIQQSFPNVTSLVGCFLSISVNVITETGSEMVHAEKNNIHIVTSPYTIHFERTPKFFKPGMPFDVMVYVTNPDHSPAENVDLVVQPGDMRHRTKNNGMAQFTVNTKNGDKTLQITARTVASGISDHRQAQKTMTAQAYVSKEGSSNYLHISVDAAEQEIGDLMKINLIFKQSHVENQDITYLILSKGQIVTAKRFKRQGQSLVFLSLPVTKDLFPSFRVVAYYHIGSSEVVSDSIWVKVTDKCMGMLKVDIMTDSKAFQPDGIFNVKVTGDPGAIVSLVAVDKAASDLIKNGLTQTKVLDLIEKHDTGCTAGSGKDSMGVFYDAGLMFESDKAGGTTERTGTECSTAPKRKRRADILPQITQTQNNYTSEQNKCCANGQKQNRLGYTCEQRAMFMVGGAECVQAFMSCCKERHNPRGEQREVLRVARSYDDDDDDGDYISSDEISVRTLFPESWLWQDIQMPACKGNIPCTNTVENQGYLKDSITTWQVQAISLSKTHGICVTDPYEITASKDFFVDLKLPYSAVHNEQIEIKAIVNNFSNRKLKVRVEFFETEQICSVASKKGKYRTIVSVDAQSSRSIPYIFIPMKVENQQIEVQATSGTFQDGIRKTLKVVPKGVLTELAETNVELNPSQHPDGVQVVNVKNDMARGQVPNTPAQSYITVSFQEASQTVKQVISGDFMGRLIKQPFGGGEETMITMTLPLITTHYLDATNQWDSIGVHRRSEAVQHIQEGYTRGLMFRKDDGSYASWINRPSSTWLTAYMAKVFSLASDIIDIKENVLCDALKWLILNAQQPDGTFKENAPVSHAEMVGDVRGKDGDTSLTAFVLIALQEGSHMCAASVTSLPHSIKKATEYLKRSLPSLTNPYAVAMTSYALANAGELNKERLLQFASEGGAYWEIPSKHYFSLEATAYAVLALLKAGDLDAAEKAVDWLRRQKNVYGSSDSTQATIMVFQAVAKYYKQSRDHQNMDLHVAVMVMGERLPISWHFDNNNADRPRSLKIQLNQEFSVTAKGTGAGLLRVETLYYARPIEKTTVCTKYALNVEMRKEQKLSYKNAEESYEIIIDILFKDPNRDATMTILDIGLLAGFVVDEGDLTKLTTGRDKYVQKFQMNKVLSERGSLIMYLDKVSHTVQDRIVFRVHKITKVALLQPAAVTVYEYYSPGERCVKFYHPTKKDGALNILCNDQEGLCQCAEENCTIQKKENIQEKDREEKACEVDTDYIYKVKVMKIDHNPNKVFYEMKIEEVLKEGSDVNPRDELRSFMGHPDCRESFGLEKGKSYLIMGQSTDLPRIEGKLQYILGGGTWIEYWPTREEGQMENYRNRYIGINALAQTLMQFGCVI